MRVDILDCDNALPWIGSSFSYSIRVESIFRLFCEWGLSPEYIRGMFIIFFMRDHISRLHGSGHCDSYCNANDLNGLYLGTSGGRHLIELNVCLFDDGCKITPELQKTAIHELRHVFHHAIGGDDVMIRPQGYRFGTYGGEYEEYDCYREEARAFAAGYRVFGIADHTIAGEEMRNQTNLFSLLRKRKKKL